MSERVEVFGPAYLDRVVHVDRPLVDPTRDSPLDQSVDGRWKFGPGLRVVDPAGPVLEIEPPPGWPGPNGDVVLTRPVLPAGTGRVTHLKALSWHDDLGGMGAGYAAALGGELVCALGSPTDEMSAAVSARLHDEAIIHRPIRVPDHPADWTLLISSGAFGDKLPIGFRGCHAAVEWIPAEQFQPCLVRVVASLANRLAAAILQAPGASVRFFAPAMRNTTDREPPISAFAEHVDVICCNRREWESIADREEVAWRVSILAVTDGPSGSIVHFTTPQGEAARIRVDAFPRSRPPRDTNRAGEAYASTLIATLLEEGWRPGVAEPDLIRRAAQRASAASALVLDRLGFGFPSRDEIDRAVQAGRVD